MNKTKLFTLLKIGWVLVISLAIGILFSGIQIIDGGLTRDLTKIESRTLIRYDDSDNHKGVPHKPNTGTNTCYSFLAQGAKWKQVEEWVVNPTNLRGLDETFIYNNLILDIVKWEDPTTINIIGNGTSTHDIFFADFTSPDGKNEIYFDHIDEPGVIAKTIVWGYFGGAPQNRELIEFDMIIDDVKFDWSSTGETQKMDFENIITHELGHAVGMGHPSDSCIEETMYRYADFGETKKRTLETGDIEGVKSLYK